MEEVTIGDYPVIEKIKQTMKDAGALNAMMSGSGQTVFGIFTDRKAIQETCVYGNTQKKTGKTGLCNQCA